eukprot:SAG31_NODE_11473_length_1026_cov_1.202805_1_plen_54_part_00
MLEDLIKQEGTNIDEVGLQGFTALHMAAHNGFPDIVRAVTFSFLCNYSRNMGL